VLGENLDGEGSGRTHEHTEALMEAFDAKTLWFDYGVVADVMVCIDFYQAKRSESKLNM
jgi:hypothetical protein